MGDLHPLPAVVPAALPNAPAHLVPYKKSFFIASRSRLLCGVLEYLVKLDRPGRGQAASTETPSCMSTGLAIGILG